MAAGKVLNGKGGIVTLLAGMAALATVHALVVVPSIMGQAREMAERMIDVKMDRHHSQFHEGTVTQRELMLVLDKITRLENSMDAQFKDLRTQIAIKKDGE